METLELKKKRGDSLVAKLFKSIGNNYIILLKNKNKITGHVYGETLLVFFFFKDTFFLINNMTALFFSWKESIALYKL